MHFRFCHSTTQPKRRLVSMIEMFLIVDPNSITHSIVVFYIDIDLHWNLTGFSLILFPFLNTSRLMVSCIASEPSYMSFCQCRWPPTKSALVCNNIRNGKDSMSSYFIWKPRETDVIWYVTVTVAIINLNHHLSFKKAKGFILSRLARKSQIFYRWSVLNTQISICCLHVTSIKFYFLLTHISYTKFSFSYNTYVVDVLSKRHSLLQSRRVRINKVFTIHIINCLPRVPHIVKTEAD